MAAIDEEGTHVVGRTTISIVNNKNAEVEPKQARSGTVKEALLGDTVCGKLKAVVQIAAAMIVAPNFEKRKRNFRK